MERLKLLSVEMSCKRADRADRERERDSRKGEGEWGECARGHAVGIINNDRHSFVVIENVGHS